MPIDPRIEEPIPLKNRTKLGIQRSKGRLRIWIEEGFYVRRLERRVYLEGIYVGNTLCTTKEAIYRFLMRTNGRQIRKRTRRPPVENSSLSPPVEELPMKKGAKPAETKKAATKKAAPQSAKKKGTKKPC